MELSAAQVEKGTGAQFTGLPAKLEQEFRETQVRGWSIDSRTVAAGDLFFAIKGEHFDGHAFAEVALTRGAVGAVISEPVAAERGPLLRVPDTLQALQGLARWARRNWNRPVVAVTGSAGKTSTKDVIAALLGVRFRVGKTIGNFNNHIGLPLTLLRIPEDAEVAVVEMGMNHAGEIRELAAIAEPQIGVVTNIGYAHIESFASIEEIAAAKRELIEGLPRDGVAILNADDERVLRFRETHPGRTLTYGFSQRADVQAENVALEAGCSRFTVRGTRFETKLNGKHSVLNILAGIAVAASFGIPLADLTPAVEQLTPGKMRGERHTRGGVTVLNDSYNSNPEAARSMIDALLREPAKRRIAVLGEMLELGRWGEALHRELGRYAAEHGVDVLIGVRGASRQMIEEARLAGMSMPSEASIQSGKGKHGSPCNRAAFFFDDPESAGEFLRGFVRAGDALLFKGSRGTQVERVLVRMEE